jgi:hypothetical protein
MSFLVSPLALSGIDDSDQPLRPRVDVEMPDLNGLLVAPPMPVQGLDQIKLKPDQLVGVGAVSVDVVLGHVPLALTQKAKPREPGRDNLHHNEGFQFRTAVRGGDNRQRSV